jgi:hypothetical protein
MAGKNFKIVGEDISDGYHTFDELYEHRCLLFINLCLLEASRCCWKADPGTPGWFILYWDSDAGQISYHIPDGLRSLIEKHIDRKDDHQWDGHTSANVRFRLGVLATRWGTR